MKIQTVLILELSIMLILLASFFIIIPNVTFTGVIEDVSGETVLVQATDGCLKSGRFRLNISNTTILLDENDRSLDLSELKIGDSITVMYFVAVLESDPWIIQATYRIKVLE